LLTTLLTAQQRKRLLALIRVFSKGIKWLSRAGHVKASAP